MEVQILSAGLRKDIMSIEVKKGAGIDSLIIRFLTPINLIVSQLKNKWRYSYNCNFIYKKKWHYKLTGGCDVYVWIQCPDGLNTFYKIQVFGSTNLFNITHDAFGQFDSMFPGRYKLLVEHVDLAPKSLIYSGY